MDHSQDEAVVHGGNDEVAVKEGEGCYYYQAATEKKDAGFA